MWGLWKRGVWQFIEMFLLQRSGREVRSYKGRNVHHLNVVTYNWTEGSIISHVRIYEQWAACLSVRVHHTLHCSPAWLMSCVVMSSEIWGWGMVTVWGHRPCGAQGDDQCPLIYDIIHSIPSTVTWLMSPTHNRPLDAWTSHDDTGLQNTEHHGE